MTDRLDLMPRYRSILEDLLREHVSNAEVWAYGSRVTGESHEGSDLDLVVRGPELKPLGDGFFQLVEAIEKSNIPILVQAHDWARLPVSFHREIEKNYVVLQAGKSMKDGRVIEVWREVQLGECSVINDSTYSPKEAWPVINYLDTGNISENRVSEIQKFQVGKHKIPSRARRKVQPGDIVYSTVRPNQRHHGLLRTVPEHFLASTGFAVLRGRDGIADTGFLYWFLAQDQIVDYLHSIAENSTSAYPSLRPSDLEQLPLKLPPLSEQRTIAHILGTLDDKIELNRRTNETLEEMARALFKSWFVDFDPVRAKAALTTPAAEASDWTVERARAYLDSMDKSVVDLFPDRLVESEIGEIPEGWEVRALGEVANVTSGKRPRSRFSFADVEAHIPLWGGNGPMGFVDLPLVEYPILLTGRVGTLGSVFRISTPCWPSDNTLIVNAYSRQFFNCLFFQMERIDFDSLNRGSTQPLLTQSDLKSQLVLLPPDEVLMHFDKLTALIFDTKDRRQDENYTLAAKRDALLPKLVSGAVRVVTDH